LFYGLRKGGWGGGGGNTFPIGGFERNLSAGHELSAALCCSYLKILWATHGDGLGVGQRRESGPEVGQASHLV